MWLVPHDENFSIASHWQKDWTDRGVKNSFLVADPSTRISGFDLARSNWVLLNRYRTRHGQCAASLHE